MNNFRPADTMNMLFLLCLDLQEFFSIARIQYNIVFWIFDTPHG
ncbi:hypothetical protein IB211_00342c [Intestinimonas butyriciproducens]|uniref:Uncharacterized protein n=1 Tax=Intestinimonas butyriciproducens TaxID=1297617 RepID=A0A0S2W068_9FIRM|nr:hypothetical protein IB211_00342c [Intestinimonas butyriciproducens]